MEKKGKWVVLSLLVLFSLVMGGFCWAQPQIIKWKGQNGYPTHEPPPPFKGFVAGGGGNAAVLFTNWVEQETKGRLQIQLAQPGAIVPVRDMFTAVSKGAIDFAGTYYGGYYTGIVPETDVEIGLPCAWQNGEMAWDAFYNRGLYEELQKVYAEHNVHFIPVIHNTSYGFGTTFPVPNPEAIKGKKIRALGIYGELVKRLGGSPVVLPGPEIYFALKLGTIDGTIIGIDTLESSKLKEVWKCYVVEPNFNTIVTNLLINLDRWKALPEDIRKLIDENAKYKLLQYSMNNSICDRLIIAKVTREYPFRVVRWSDQDIAKVTKLSFSLWDSVAAKSPRTAKLVDIVRNQMKDLEIVK